MLARDEVVNFVKLERIDTMTADLNRFEYRPDRGWLWLQRAAFAVLRWIGAHHMPTVTTYRRTAQENDDLLKSLLAQRRQWFDYVHHDEMAHIYMGPDDERDLMKLCDFRDMQYTTLKGGIETRDQYGRKWHDVPITVVPWMKGAIIVPRV